MSDRLHLMKRRTVLALGASALALPRQGLSQTDSQQPGADRREDKAYFQRPNDDGDAL